MKMSLLALAVLSCLVGLPALDGGSSSAQAATTVITTHRDGVTTRVVRRGRPVCRTVTVRTRRGNRVVIRTRRVCR